MLWLTENHNWMQWTERWCTHQRGPKGDGTQNCSAAWQRTLCPYRRQKWSLFPLSYRHKKTSVGMSLQLLQWHAAKGDDFLFNTVTCVKSCFHHLHPETKQEHGMASHISKKGQNCTLSWQNYGNCLLGCILVNFLPKWETKNCHPSTWHMTSHYVS